MSEIANASLTNATTGQVLVPPLPKSIFEIPHDIFKIYAFITNIIATSIVCILGITGNSLGVLILWHGLKFRKQSIHCYMIALMTFDNVYLMIGLIVATGSIIQEYDFWLATTMFVHLSFMTGYLDIVFYHASSSMLIVMALERLNALVRPFTVKESWLSLHPIKIIVSITGFNIIFALPFPISFRIVERPVGNLTFYNIQRKDELRQFYDQYNFIETFISGLYPIIMLVLNIAIPIAYCRVTNKRRVTLPNKSVDDTQQFKITMTVLWISVLYTILAVPKLFLQVLFYMDNNYNFDGIFVSTFYFLTFAGDILARLNAANDFFIYVLVSKRYRKILWLLLTRKFNKTHSYKSTDEIFKDASQNFTKFRESKRQKENIHKNFVVESEVDTQ